MNNHIHFSSTFISNGCYTFPVHVVMCVKLSFYVSEVTRLLSLVCHFSAPAQLHRQWSRLRYIVNCWKGWKTVKHMTWFTHWCSINSAFFLLLLSFVTFFHSLSTLPLSLSLSLMLSRGTAAITRNRSSEARYWLSVDHSANAALHPIILLCNLWPITIWHVAQFCSLLFLCRTHCRLHLSIMSSCSIIYDTYRSLFNN